MPKGEYADRPPFLGALVFGCRPLLQSQGLHVGPLLLATEGVHGRLEFVVEAIGVHDHGRWQTGEGLLRDLPVDIVAQDLWPLQFYTEQLIFSVYC
eukprot:7384514-Pyramimonas_sp.AAC.1